MNNTSSFRVLDALHLARRRNASDLHLASGAPPFARIDGAFEILEEAAFSADELNHAGREIIGESSWERLERDGEVTVSWEASVSGIVRIHAYRGSSGISLTPVTT